MANIKTNSELSKDVMMKSRKWYVIALSGASCGGKTTIAMKLLNTIPANSVYISQDEYILPNDYQGHLKAPEPLQGLNKDSLHSIDMDRMITDINYVLENDIQDINVSDEALTLDRKKIIGSALKFPRPAYRGLTGKSSSVSVLILDGFLLFNHPNIPPLCHSIYFLTLTKDECWERRKNRTFTAPGMDARMYFDLCMWPKYEQHFQEMTEVVTDIQYINGGQPFESNYNMIFRDVMNSLDVKVQ